MAEIRLTPEQQKVVDTRNCNLLVAAAAGSGKTAVLVKRIIKKVTEEGQDIDRLLIVTFTNAAASEMKEKIRRAISQAVTELAEQVEQGDMAAAENLVFLKQQLNLLPQAQISTFHAFALEVIRKYHKLYCHFFSFQTFVLLLLLIVVQLHKKIPQIL